MYDGERHDRRPQKPLGNFDLAGALILAAIIIAVPWIGIPLVVFVAFFGRSK